MKSNQPSTTAAIVALARGLAAFLPAPARLASDPHGMQFGGPISTWFGRLATQRPDLMRALIRPRSRLELGILWLQLRTRVLDEVVAKFAAAGGRQVLLLGAGYDTRASRLTDITPELAFFEVDHPATQRHKRRVLAQQAVQAPRARYLAWDFESQALAQLPAALAELGHEPSLPTLTVWEGVTMYLTDQAIDASVRCVRSLSAPGSLLALTYFERRSLKQQPIVRRFVARVGEPLRFGWDSGELEPYLRERGWRLVSDENPHQLAQRLLPEPYASRSFRDFRHVAVAEVPASGGVGL